MSYSFHQKTRHCAKRLLALILVFCLIFTASPGVVSANAQDPASLGETASAKTPADGSSGEETEFEASSSEAPSSEAPSSGASSSEASSSEASSSEASSSEASSSEASSSEASSSEAPSSEASTGEAPAGEGPAVSSGAQKCSCGAENRVQDSGEISHDSSCPFYVAPKAALECDCGAVADVNGKAAHAEGCPLYVLPEPDGGAQVDDLLALIDGLPAPADALEQRDKPWRADAEVAEAARAALTDKQRAALPAEAVQKLDALLHFIQIVGDCPDFGCPWHYPPEVRALMNENETPAPLTLDDLIEDYGVAQPRRLFALRAAAKTNPQTLMITDDNENNAHTGIPDGDLDQLFYFWDNAHPIEVRFDLEQAPTQSAYIAIKALDIDEEAGEDDHVFVNGKEIGMLSGTDDTWNTTVLEIPIDLLKVGKNYVKIELSEDMILGLLPAWVAQVDWVQLVLDGGAADDNLERFQIKLGEPVNSSDNVQISAETTIVQNGNTQYVTEYTLVDPSTGNALDAVFGTAQTTEHTSLQMSKSSPTGIYKIIGILKDSNTEEIKASDEVTFFFEKGVGVVLRPKLTHTITPGSLTNQNVQIAVTVEDTMDCTDISIQGGGQRTVTDNGDQAFTVTYRSYGTAKNYVYTVPVKNIDRTPPVIEFGTFSVEEKTIDAEVERLFERSLRVTDDRQLTGKPSYTLPENLAAAIGNKTVTVTATDTAGNTATKDCTITVLPLSVRLAQPTAVRVGETDSFTLSSTLEDTGGLTFTETGFVWGVMQSPTINIKNDQLATDSPVTTRGGSISVTAEDIVDGVDYHVRAYVFAGGRVYYSDQTQFSIGAKQYGVFSVQNNGTNTFTITRSNGVAEAQTVYYRTVNGSAVGGTHFTHLAESVVFRQGETSKTVTVTEAAVDAVYGANPATGYTNADRTYQLELYKVQGGGRIDAGGARATRTLSKIDNKTISRDIYEFRKAKEVTTKEGDDNRTIYEDEEGQSYKCTALISELKCAAPDGSTYPDGQYIYLWNTVSAMRFQLRDFTARDDKNVMPRYVLFNKSTEFKFDKDKGEAIPNLPAATKLVLTYKRASGDSREATSVQLPQPVGAQVATGPETGQPYTVREIQCAKDQDPNAGYVLYNLGETCYISVGVYHSAAWKAVLTFEHAKLFSAPHDTREPQVLGIAPMAGGQYKPGDAITVSVVFDEIVDSQNSSLAGTTINTSYGVMTYAGGADTNVLYYTGTVPPGVSGSVELSSFSNAEGIKDMCLDDGTGSAGSGSADITVDSTQPTVSIKSGGIKDGTATGTITATSTDLLQYTWTQSAGMPVAGWLTCNSGDAVQTRQLSGEWYLHVLATRNANGAVAYAKQLFDFGLPEAPVSPLPTLTLSADNTNWAHSRDITVTRTPANAAVIYDGPQSGTAGGTVTVTQNGIYTFTLTSGDETVTEQVLVSKLDAVAPTLTIRESGNTDAVYHELNFGASASDDLSGVAKVEYSWSNTTTPGNWTEASGSGGDYIIPTYTATEPTKTTKYLHVRATDHAGNVTTQASKGYIVLQAPQPAQLPAITLTGAPSAWTKGHVNLSWNVTNQGAGGIRVNVGGLVESKDKGTLTVRENGIYSATVTDQNNNSASAQCIVNYIDAEAPVLSAISCAPGGWAKQKTVTVAGVSDNRTPIFGADGTVTGYSGSGSVKQEWKLDSGEYTVFTGNSFTVAASGTCTVRLTDKLGNQNEYTLKISQTDSAAPTVKVSAPAAGWTGAAQNIRVEYADNMSVKTAQYAITTTNTGAKPTSLDNLPASGQSVRVSANGQYYLYYKVTDHAGNVTEGYSDLIKVDTTTPTISVNGNPEIWQNTDAPLTLIVSGAGPSGQTVTVKKGSGTAQNITNASYTVSENGEYLFTVTTGASKTATQTVVVNKIDKTNPGPATVALNPATPNANGWHKALDIGVTQPTPDGGAPIITYYKLWKDRTSAPANGTALTPGATAINAPADGSWKLCTYTADTAGNRSADSATLTFKLDRKAPTIGALTYRNQAANLWNWIIGKKDLVITVHVTENGSGADAISYTATPESGKPETKSVSLSGAQAEITFDAEFKGQIAITCTDKAGNVSSSIKVATNGVIVEERAPEITITPPAGMNAAGWYNAPFSVDVSAQDNNVSGGLAQIQWKIGESGNVTTVTDGFSSSLTTGHRFTVPVNADGEQTIFVRAADNAGNQSAWSTSTVKLDAKEPELTVTGGQTGAASLTLSVAANYGPSGGQVTVNGGNKAVAGSYLIETKGSYAFTAASVAGRSTTVTKQVYGVTFDSVGGSSVAGQIVVSGGKAVKPANPTRVGYTFSKWQHNGEDFDFATKVIAADTTLAAVWTLDAPAVSLAVDKSEVRYNGGATVATLTATPKHQADGVSYTYEWYRGETKLNGEAATMPLTDVAHSGGYNVKVAAVRDGQTSAQTKSNTVQVLINKADTKIITEPTAGAITYGQALNDSKLTGGAAGAAKVDLLTRLVSSGELPGTFSWSNGTENPVVADSGKTAFSVTFIPDDTANYNTSTAEITLTVHRKPLTPSVAAVQDKGYDGNTAAEGTLSLAGAVFSQSPAASGSFEFTDRNKGENKAVNVSDIALLDNWGDNYRLDKIALSDVVTTAKITPRTVQLLWSGHTGLVYTGRSVSVTAAATNLAFGDTCTVTVDNGEKIDAGGYTATATALSDDNYALPAEASQGYTIAKAPVTFAVINNIQKYDADFKTATVEQTADEMPKLAGSFTVSYEQNGSEVEKPTNVGIYDLLVEITDVNFKHKGEQDSVRKIKVGTLAIQEVTYPAFDNEEMTWPEAEALEYGQTLTDSVLLGGNQTEFGKYSWKDGDTKPTVENEGYSVVFTPNDTNYAPVEQGVLIEVSPKELTVSGAAAENRDYIPKDQTVRVAGGELVGVVTREGKLDDVILADDDAAGTITFPDAGEGKAVAVLGYAITGTDKGNYTLRQPEGITVDITPAEGTAAAALESWTYDGAAKTPVPKSDTNGTDKVAYSYFGKEGSDTTYGPSADCPVDAGEYTVTATFPATTNYRKVTASADFTVAKKTVSATWGKLLHVYDGSAKTPEFKGLVGVLEDDKNVCTVKLSGAEERTNAGSKIVTASLAGEKAHNYALANSRVTFTIQKVPVIFTVAGNSHQKDGEPHSAKVTAKTETGTEVEAFTITYLDSKEQVVDAPAEIGSYGIYAALTDPNYRHSDAPDGGSRRIGVLNIYAARPPQIYQVTFAPGGEDVLGLAPTLPGATSGTVHIMPGSNTLNRPEHAFAGWLLDGKIYTPGEEFHMPARNVTFTALWKKSTFEIGGIVNQEGQPVVGALVTLMRGSQQISEVLTDLNGRYQFPSVTPGLYNLVASYGGITQTVMTLIVDIDKEEVISLPLGKTNSIVEVVEGTPAVIVGNLEKLFDRTDSVVFTDKDKAVVEAGGVVEIKMTVQAMDGPKSNETLLINEALSELPSQYGYEPGVYLDITLDKTVESVTGELTHTAIPEVDELLESVISLPAKLQSRKHYKVLRVHEGAVAELTEKENAEGEFIEISQDKTELTTHTKKHSTYMILASDYEPSSTSDDDPPPKPQLVPKENPKPEIEQKPEATASAPPEISSVPARTQAAQPQEEPSQEEPSQEEQPEKEAAPVYNGQDNEHTDDEPLQSTQSESSRPFVLLSGLLALTAIAFAALSIVKKQEKKRIIFTVSAASAAVLVFLLTSGFDGVILANGWTFLAAVLTLAAVLGVLGIKKEEQPQGRE